MEALTYTYSQENAQAEAQFFGFSFRMQYIPYCLLFLTFVQAGKAAALSQATGLVSAHAYLYLTTIYPRTHRSRSLLSTPSLLTRLLPGRPAQNGNRGFGQVFNAQGATRAPNTTGATVPIQATTARTTGSRYNWGRGHRLGSD